MSTYLVHHGIKGMKWGVRRYQNADGSLTSAGRNRYGVLGRAGSAVINRIRKQQETAKRIGKSRSGKQIAVDHVIRRVKHNLVYGALGSVAVSALSAAKYRSISKGKSGYGYDRAARVVRKGMNAAYKISTFNDYAKTTTEVMYKYNLDEKLDKSFKDLGDSYRNSDFYKKHNN